MHTQKPESENKEKQPEGNVPLTGDQVQKLEMLKREVTDSKKRTTMVPMVCHQDAFPNRRQRRIKKQRYPHHNAKANKARQYQLVSVAVIHETKMGKVAIPTGLMRRIMHNQVVIKEWEVNLVNRNVLYGRKRNDGSGMAPGAGE